MARGPKLALACFCMALEPRVVIPFFSNSVFFLSFFLFFFFFKEKGSSQWSAEPHCLGPGPLQKLLLTPTLLLLLSRFSRVRLSATPQTAAHQASRPWDSPGKNIGVGCHFLLQCMKVKSESEVAQSCPTLSDTMDCSLPGSSVHGIFQAKSTGVGCRCLLRIQWASSNQLKYVKVQEMLDFLRWGKENGGKENQGCDFT